MDTDRSTLAADPKSIALRCIEIMANGSPADFDAVVHVDARDHENVVQPPASRIPGPAGYFETAKWLRATFDDLRYEIDHVVADGDLVAVNSTMSGRHVAPFVVYTAAGEVDAAFPPTGKTFAVTQSHWLRVKDGQVIEHWANRDDLGQAQQLGWVPPTPAYLFRMASEKRRARKALAG